MRALLAMKKNELGTTGIHVSQLAFGCGSVMSRAGKSSSLRAMATAFDYGINFFDVAPSYGDGLAEAVLGEFARDRRSQLVLGTKYGLVASTTVKTRLLRAAKRFARPLLRSSSGKRLVASVQSSVAAVPRFERTPLTSAGLVASVERSLRALRTDYLDIIYLHSCTAEDIENDDVLNTATMLLQSGKIRTFGAATSAAELLAANRSLPVAQISASVALAGSLEAVAEVTERGTAVVSNHTFGGLPLSQLHQKLGRLEDGAGETGTLHAVLSAPLKFGSRAVIVSMLTPEHVASNALALRAPA